MIEIYKASNFPILQNKVYPSKDDALNCLKADIRIMVGEDGLIYNSEFDPNKMVYDEDYDNSVPSEYFKNYYASIIQYLQESYKLNSESLILDIGCGKGTFLKQMFADNEYLGKGIGIDPSYEGDESLFDNRLLFIKEYFNDGHLKNIRNVSLILLRHTLEHIPGPSSFLKHLFEIIEKCNIKNVPIFIEVPDVDWIFENKAYWDFFYEHVNYFSKESLKSAILKAGGKITSLKNAFGNQYQWAEAIINSGSKSDQVDSFPAKFVEQPIDFNIELSIVIGKMRMRIAGSNLVIWGMASKGIIYSLHLIDNRILPNYFVDINANKQNKYLPIIGEPIISPNKLPKDKKLLVVCMNPNYIEEIRNECNKLKLNFELISPNTENC
jgi:SAM-dependent methyltransferase